MKKLLLSGCSILVTFSGQIVSAQTTVAPAGVIIQESESQPASAAQQLAVCIASLNSVQNESEAQVTLYGSYRPLAIDHPYRFAKPSNVSEDEMHRVGLRNRDGDDVWVGDVPSVVVATVGEDRLSNREIMELCLDRTPQFGPNTSNTGEQQNNLGNRKN